MSGHAGGNEVNILGVDLKETLKYRGPGRRQNSDPINVHASEVLKDSFFS